jgi:Autographiviridae endonuclease VII
MLKPLKICKKHGELFENDVLEEKAYWKDSGSYYRCKKCRQEKDLKYKHSHREQHIAYTKKWREENKEHYLEWLRNDRKNNPEKHKKWKEISKIKQGKNWRFQENLNKYDLTIETYNRMLLEQNNICAICHQPETRQSRTKGETARLCIDHCHKTNIIRGLLCHNCNTMIGKAFDNIEILESAINYLKKFAT